MTGSDQSKGKMFKGELQTAEEESVPFNSEGTEADVDLVRFLDAQDSVHEQVTLQLKAGKKRSHWMWFIFPQLEGLGRSMMADHYGISDLNQARRYLAHGILGERLRQYVRLMLLHENKKSALEILGHPNHLKFQSCMTLFHVAAMDSEEDKALFSRALDAFYGGRTDPRTLQVLGFCASAADFSDPMRLYSG